MVKLEPYLISKHGCFSSGLKRMLCFIFYEQHGAEQAVVIEAMKMEINAQALMDGEVAEILIKEGDTVKGGQLLIRIK